jgi:hypothetical protein
MLTGNKCYGFKKKQDWENWKCWVGVVQIDDQRSPKRKNIGSKV